MKKLYKILASLIIFFSIFSVAFAAINIVPNGGTGVGTITGIPYGTGTAALGIVSVGTGLSFTGGTLTATGSGSPGGSDTQVQFNDSGSFGGNAGLVFTKTNGYVGIASSTPIAKLDVRGSDNLTIYALSSNTGGTSFQLDNSSSGAHSYQFFVTGSAAGIGAGKFGVYDAAENNTTLSIFGGTSSTAGQYITTSSNSVLGWNNSSNGGTSSVPDTAFSRLSANKVALGNGTATDASGTLVSANIGVGVTSPTARLHIAGGTATASTAPLKINSGTLLSTTEAGAVENDGTHLYYTAANAGTRFQLDQQLVSANSLTGTILASNVVTSSLTTVGTIGTGIWQGNPVGTAYGGTGCSVASITCFNNITGFTTGGTTGTTSTNLVFSTSPTLVTPALGTPSALVGTNITGTASGLTAGTVTTNANLTGPITSSGNATSIASQTGTGTKFVVDTSPTIATPIFSTDFTSPIWIPAADSTTAIQIDKANASTNVVDVDTTNSRIGLGGNTAPASVLDIGSGTPTTAVNGLNFGTDTTADLYRLAAGSIKTDGTFTAAGNVVGGVGVFTTNTTTPTVAPSGNNVTLNLNCGTINMNNLACIKITPTNITTATGNKTVVLDLLPPYNQTGTASATDIMVNRTETALGSGTQLFEDFQVAGASKFSVDHTGIVNINLAQTTYSGSISGTAKWSMPFQGTAFKKFIINYQSLHDAGGTISFPTAFANTPYCYGDSGALAISSATTSTFTIAVAATITGNVFCDGE